MMEAIGKWILTVAAASVCLAVFRAAVPKGAVKAVARVSGGLVLLAVLLRPLTGWDVKGLELRYEGYRQQVEAQTAFYRDSYQQQLELGIEEKTAAYISEKAAQLGLSCHAEVVTQQEGGVPVPTEVRLDIPEDAALSAWIAEELAIPAARQYWKETP